MKQMTLKLGKLNCDKKEVASSGTGTLTKWDCEIAKTSFDLVNA